jgi:type II secretory pathway component PulC
MARFTLKFLFSMSLILISSVVFAATKNSGKHSVSSPACVPKPEPHCEKTGAASMAGVEMKDVSKDAVAVRYAPKKILLGYLLKKTKDCGILESAGLRQCDVIVSVNGINVDSQRKFLDVYGLLHDSGGPVEVIRDNARMILKIK